MTKPFVFDEIGYWSEVKLEIIKKYASAYAAIMHAHKEIKNFIYIDAFSGPGRHISRNTKELVMGSPLNALAITPPFSEYHLIDLDGDKAEELQRQVGSQNNVFIHEGDANNILIEKVFPKCQYCNYNRALCLLDPYALNVDWNVLKAAGQMGSIEIFYNFMIMDANMNILWRRSDKVNAVQTARMDKVWGDQSWKDAAYVKRPTLFGDLVDEKTNNESVAEAFRLRLNKDGGFKYVPKPVPMRNNNGATIYYLFFASPNRAGASIVEDIFNAYRTKGRV